jgi:predicted RNA-binding protein with PUA-like domain
MAHWLLKSEPFVYPWSKLVTDGTAYWDGVRNYTARNNMQAMKLGDRGFFYHSNEGLEIVGVVEIVREAYPDATDLTGRFVMVDFKPVMPVVRPVTLKEMKADPRLAEFRLIRQSRLSVVPVTDEEWALICDKAGIAA